MFFAILLALTACFFWSFIFIVPAYLPNFSSIEVALGRYFFYGIISTLFLIFFSRSRLIKYPLVVWSRALMYGLLANVLYYLLLVVGVKMAGSEIASLITALSPITISYFASKKSAAPVKNLTIPAILMMVGIISMHIDFFTFEFSQVNLRDYLIGLIAIILSLVSWTWFAVSNMFFLQQNLQIRRFDWSTLIGFTTFLWVLVLMVCFALFDGNLVRHFYINYQSADMKLFLISTAFLGVFCSWLGSFLWNSCCKYLPGEVSGQLIIFESIFALVFIYIIEGSMPSLFEMVGLMAMIMAVVYSLRIYFLNNQRSKLA